jgi:hypothetical protein
LNTGGTHVLMMVLYIYIEYRRNTCSDDGFIYVVLNTGGTHVMMMVLYIILNTGGTHVLMMVLYM